MASLDVSRITMPTMRGLVELQKDLDAIIEDAGVVLSQPAYPGRLPDESDQDDVTQMTLFYLARASEMLNQFVYQLRAHRDHTIVTGQGPSGTLGTSTVERPN